MGTITPKGESGSIKYSALPSKYLSFHKLTYTKVLFWIKWVCFLFGHWWEKQMFNLKVFNTGSLSRSIWISVEKEKAFSVQETEPVLPSPWGNLEHKPVK